MAALKLTATQQRFFDLMADGNRHTMQEFINLLPDELGDSNCVRGHIFKLRKAIEGVLPEEIICEIIYRKTTYRRVRKLYSQGE